MLIVQIYVNHEQIGCETAVRIKGDTGENSINTYRLGSNGKEIKHRYGDGAAALAEKMMKNLKTQRRDRGILSTR